MINALSIDVEYWYNNEFLTKYLPENKEDQVLDTVPLVLDLLNKYHIKGTFFVLGIVAEKYPDLIRNIYDSGHEIASHGYSHKMLTQLDQKEFEYEIVHSVKLLENITGKRPIGFRAPSFSINKTNLWALDILKKHGFRYDASVFPIRTHLYGVPDAPLSPYKPSENDLVKVDADGNFFEFPMTVFKIGINLPITGGFYLRSIPVFFQRKVLEQINRTRPFILYFHPWEIYPHTPVVKHLPLTGRFVSRVGIGKPTYHKLEVLFRHFQFKPLCEVLEIV
jgi:peptidoglycan-N-acetylglucosamine deacetylase